MSGGNQYLDAIQAAYKAESSGTEFSFTQRDVMLYNLGIGAKRTDLKYVLYVSSTSLRPSSKG